MFRFRYLLILTIAFPFADPALGEQPVVMNLRTQFQSDDDIFLTKTEPFEWLSSQTAIIVCDVWDKHHCLNAVRRVNEFAPRLDQVLQRARELNVTIIHAPSDCMEAYQDHPARRRAQQAPRAASMPDEMGSWCSIIPAEERAVYPIDQSDGGEDDDPAEHAAWAAKLEAMGRNPNAPWKKQCELITIDPEHDFITDQGEEVWNVLTQRGIKNVVLAGVHTNMCVLGRPFGLRQMVRHGKNTVLMRDMTDTMYNPARWPYVSHFEGTRRVIDHIERYVCPTITSDQWIGGKPFRFAGDDGVRQASSKPRAPAEWTSVQVPDADRKAADQRTPHWYRCVIRVPAKWSDQKLEFKCRNVDARLWVNGHELIGKEKSNGNKVFPIDAGSIEFSEANLFVLQLPGGSLHQAPIVRSGERKLKLAGRWQIKIDNDPANSNMPLPSKFGASTDIVFIP